MAIEIYPVIHIHDVNQAVGQASLAFDHKADGVFLIDHRSEDEQLLVDAFNAVTEAAPRKFVGINFLQHRSAAQSLGFLQDEYDNQRISDLPSGLWSDNAYIDRGETRQLREASEDLHCIRYLGGVAFKYTGHETADPQQAAREADNLMKDVDVVTTSGIATGVPPTPEKISAMKQRIGRRKLAVASGITFDNLRNYGKDIDQLLVSTSIEKERGSGIFDPRKLASLIDLAHAIETS